MSKNVLFNNKELIGKILFIISFLLFIYMFIIPISSLYIHIDEYFTINLIRFPFDMALTVIKGDVHPPLYYFILIGFVNLLRVLSIPFDLVYASKVVSIIPYGLLLIFSYTKIRKDYSFFVAGLFTFSIATMGSIFFEFLTMRMYSWGLLFLVMAFIYLGDVYRKSTVKSWILFTFFSICSIYTHNMLLFSVGFMYLLLLAHIYLMNVNSEKKKILFKVWICSVLVLFISYIPWIMVLISQISSRHNNGGTFALNQLWTNLIGYATMDYSSFIIALFVLLFLIFIMAIAISIYLKRKNRTNSYILSGILIFLLTYIVGSTVLPLVFGPVVPRYLVPVYGVLWFSIVVLTGDLEKYSFNKINKEKLFTISLIIILILGCFGFLTTVKSADEEYNKGYNEKVLLESINNENSTILFAKSWFYVDYQYYVNNSDVYLLEPTHSKSIIKDNYIVEKNITKIIEDNPDKNIYLFNKTIKKGSLDKNIKYEKIGFSKIYCYNLTLRSNNTN